VCLLYSWTVGLASQAGHPLLSHCYRCEVPLKAKWPELAEGFVAHPKVCRGCAACFKFLHAKWAIFSCAAKYSRAGFAMCKLLTWQLPSNCNLLTSDNRPSVIHSGRSFFPITPPVCCLNIVRMVVSPCSSHSFRILMVRHDVAVVRELFMADGTFLVLLHDLSVQKLAHLGR